MSEVEKEKNGEYREDGNFFKGLCIGTLISLPIWVIIGLTIRYLWLAII